MSIFAIDPSYSGCGISLYSQEETDFAGVFRRIIPYQDGFFYTKKFGIALPDKSFTGHYIASDLLVNEIKGIIDMFSPDSVVMEYPTPVGRYAAGLYMLDTKLLEMLIKVYEKQLYLIPPNAINSYLGKRSLTKAQIVRAIQEKVDWFDRINAEEIHDECSAIALTLLCARRVNKESEKPTIYEYVKGTFVKF